MIMSDQTSDVPRVQLIIFKTMEPSSPAIRFEDIVQVTKCNDGLFSRDQITIHFDKMTPEHAPRVKEAFEWAVFMASPEGRWEQARRYFNALPRPFAPEWVVPAERLGNVIIAIRHAPEMSEERLEIAKLLMQEVEVRRQIVPLAREKIRSREQSSRGGHNSAKLRGEALEEAKILCIQSHRKDPTAKKSDLNRALQEFLKRKFDITMSYSGLAPYIVEWLEMADSTDRQISSDEG